MVIGRRIASEKFIVRRLSTPEEVSEIMFERMAAEGWRPGALDHVSFFAAILCRRIGWEANQLLSTPIWNADNFAFLHRR